MNKAEPIKKRSGHLDVLKAFAILMVFVGHRIDSIAAEQYIYSFHLPLFFWISGCVFDPDKYRKFSSFLSRRFRTILVPYFVFATVSFLFWFFIVRGLSVRGQVLSIDPWYPFLGIFYGIGVDPWRNPLDIALWFLPCLFVTAMIYWHVNRHLSAASQVLAIVLLGTAGYLTSVWLPLRLPWSADVALTAVVFYGVGSLCRKNLRCILTLKPLWKSAALVALAAVGFALSHFNGKADMNYNHFGNPLFFYPAAFAGIYLCHGMTSQIPTMRLVTYIGQNTIVLIGLGGVSTFVIRGFQYLFSGSLHSTGKTGLFETLSFSALEICLLIPVMYAINRFIPSILGREKSTGRL